MRLKDNNNPFIHVNPPYQLMVIHSSKLVYPRELYQRGVERKRVELIAAHFNEYVANEPKVSFRNGQFIVTDGQHTIEGRILRNGGFRGGKARRARQSSGHDPCSKRRSDPGDQRKQHAQNCACADDQDAQKHIGFRIFLQIPEKAWPGDEADRRNEQHQPHGFNHLIILDVRRLRAFNKEILQNRKLR